MTESRQGMSNNADRAPYRPGLAAVFDVVHRLRQPDGCPWDREQTHESLRPYLLEETYEVLEAIEAGDDERLRDELGDLLLQVAMHAEIAAQEGRFDAAQVSEAAAAKMVARHPHVFGDEKVADAEEVLRNWEHRKIADAKAAGRGHESVLDRVPKTLPALAWALNLQKRAARVGFDYEDARAASAAVAEEAEELADAGDQKEKFDEVGDLLFALVALARKLKVNPEDALRVAGGRFARRFAEMEDRVRHQGRELKDLSPSELLALWQSE
jgi:tetrapyrrole methylase family protein / MazG family protein